jgi:hypothetical protein
MFLSERLAKPIDDDAPIEEMRGDTQAISDPPETPAGLAEGNAERLLSPGADPQSEPYQRPRDRVHVPRRPSD